MKLKIGGIFIAKRNPTKLAEHIVAVVPSVRHCPQVNLDIYTFRVSMATSETDEHKNVLMKAVVSYLALNYIDYLHYFLFDLKNIIYYNIY